MDYKKWAEEMDAEIQRVTPILGGAIWGNKPLTKDALIGVWNGLRRVHSLHTPYPGHCIHPEKCRGRSSCPRGWEGFEGGQSCIE